MAAKPSSGLRPSRSLGSRVIGIHLETIDHEELLVRRGPRSGLYSAVAVHSTARGPSLGGCRMWRYEDTRAGLRDALRLSRAMTFKSAAAGLPLGGGKGVIMLGAGDPPLDGAAPPRRPARLRRRRRGARRALRHGGGRRHLRRRHDRDRGADGPRGRPRRGARRLGRPEPVDGARRRGRDPRRPARRSGARRPHRPDDRGHRPRATSAARSRAACRGRRLARARRRRGGKRALADELGAAWAEPAEALRAAVDVVAPCALGGVLDEESVPRAALPRGRRRREQPARRRTRSPTRSTPAGSSGRPTSWPTRAASSTSPSSSSPRATTPAAPASASARSATRSAPCSRPPSATGVTPLAAAMALARERLGGEPLIRPSSRSLSRWAWSVHVAGSSSPGGIASQAPASSSSSVRAPASHAATMRRSRSSRWATYSSSFAAGSSTTGRARGRGGRGRGRGGAAARRGRRRASRRPAR